MQNTAQFTEDILSSLRGRIAIVGNATPRHEFGEVIDRYDHVIRLNNFRIAGFEKWVGSKTSFRCTSAWSDIEHRNEQVEFSPFLATGAESFHLENFNRENREPVLAASTNVSALVPEIPKPSTGFALIQLCAHLGLSVDLFGFDGFKSAHYWDANKTFSTTHSQNEIDFLLQLPGVLLFGETYPYEKLYDYCHEEHTEYDQNVGLELVRRLKKEFRGLTMLEFGSGNGELARYLEKMGNQVTAVEASQFAFDKIACTQKIHGTALSLPLIQNAFDCFISVDVLEHLTENDVKIVIREAARLAKSIFVSVCTRPSGLLGPNGENLHLTVKPASWWQKEFEKYFSVRTSAGYGHGQLVIEGKRKANYILGFGDFGGDVSAQKQNEFYQTLFTQSDDWSKAQPNEDESARWQQIEPLVREITRALSERGCVVGDQPQQSSISAKPSNPTPCGWSGTTQPRSKSFRILDLGCGRGWLTNLLSQYGQAEGVEPVASVIDHARSLFPNLQFTAGNAETILSREDFTPYDLVVSSEVIEHVTDKAAFAADLKRLLKPDGHLILTTPRGESLLEWTRLFGDPSQPVEDWMTEPQLKEVFQQAGFSVKKHQRVWFDISERRFTDVSSVATSDNLIAIYQVWKFQFVATAENPGDSAEQILSQFHFASRAAAEFALKKLPGNPILLAAQATSLLALREVELARAAAIEAVALHPDFLPARELVAKILRELGRNGEAEIHETRARGLREKDFSANALKQFSFLDHLDEATLLHGDKAQIETRFASINEVGESCLYLHPPAQLQFEVSTSSAGTFTTAIAIQPEAWEQPGAGGCEFFIELNGERVFTKRINPTKVPSDRAWHEVAIDFPASAIASHKFVFGTRAIGTPADFRWALWRRPVFEWKSA